MSDPHSPYGRQEKVEAALSESATPPNAGATKPEGSPAAGAQDSSSRPSSLLLPRHGGEPPAPETCTCRPSEGYGGIVIYGCPVHDIAEARADTGARQTLLDLSAALEDMTFARQSHLDWAEHLEAHVSSGVPCAECAEKPYRLNADHEREWVTKYDRIIALLDTGARQTSPARTLADVMREHIAILKEIHAPHEVIAIAEQVYAQQTSPDTNMTKEI